MYRIALIALAISVGLSCQGPWSYYPEDSENYRGIWITAYIVSGRPVTNVCLEKIHDLKEVYMRGFAFYDSASIEIKGSFNGKDTSIFLKPDSGHFPHSPNCFLGDRNLIPSAGENYSMNASITWDSAGKKVTSEFSAQTYIPKKFKIKRAYDLRGNRFKDGQTIRYSLPEDDEKFNYIYFIPEYSNEDIGGALVSMVYDCPDCIYWGENILGEIANQINDEGSAMLHAQFGDRQLLYTATNTQMANTGKDIDSIPILGLRLPAYGDIKLLFYATTREYMDYQNTFLQGDSRVKPVYNIKGGAGIFAGMLVDTFEISMTMGPWDDIQTYSFLEAQDAYCRTWELGTTQCLYKTDRKCVGIWDKIIVCEIKNGKPDDPKELCAYDDYTVSWTRIPSDDLRKVLSMKEIITWCGFRDFPIKQYPLCGSAMVHLYNSGKKSVVLEREVKKWCEEHKDDVECFNVLLS